MSYRELKDELDEVTKYCSSGRTCLEHPIFAKIVEMENAVSLALQDLREDKGCCHNCFHILYKVVGNSPVKEESRGLVPKMIEDWLEWGKNHG